MLVVVVHSNPFAILPLAIICSLYCFAGIAGNFVSPFGLMTFSAHPSLSKVLSVGDSDLSR